MSEHSYDEGVRDGKIEALEKMMIEHKETTKSRFNHHDSRISVLEKIAYGAAGITVFIQLLPYLSKFVGAL